MVLSTEFLFAMISNMSLLFFSKIAQILVTSECIAFIVNELVTEYFSEHHHPFVVCNGEDKDTVIELKSL